MDIESREFRRLARRNCYKYGPLYIYSDSYVCLDEHKFPKYGSKESTGNVEKFLSLVQSLGKIAGGNDAAEKLAKPLPGVQWGDDDLSLSLQVEGVMYFTDYNDYRKQKNMLRGELVRQGWEQTVSQNQTLGWSLTTYKPAMGGSDALYNDDPADAAGLAMMASAMQHVSTQVQISYGYLSGDQATYAEGKARQQASMTGQSAGLPSIVGPNVMAGIEAMGANMNSGVVGKWAYAGRPLELLVDGQVARQSVNGVLTSASFTEEAYAVDDTSNGYVYPTQMRVSIGITNMYGGLFNTSRRSK